MNEVVKVEDHPIAAYDKFRAQLSELEEANSKAVFDYADPDGNKEARSHVYKLRKTKTAVDGARKTEKADSLAYGRRVDSEAGEIITQIESMIAVHEKPLKDIENKEKERVEAHELACMALTTYEHVLDVDCHSSTIKLLVEELRALEPDENYEEFTGAAIKAYKKSMAVLEEGFAAAEKREAEQDELKRFREEQEDRERQDREAQIAREATEKADREAKEAAEKAEVAAKKKLEQAEREKQEAIEREARLKREAEESERRRIEQEDREKREAEEREIQRGLDAKESERRRIEDQKLAEERTRKAVEKAEEKQKQDALDAARVEREDAEKREKNKKHKAKINNAAVDALVAGGVSVSAAKKAVILIAKREIPNVSISY